MEFPSQFLPLFALYPEIHYRFKAFPFSRYYRRQPEIVADAPWRLEPEQPLPILLLIKDARRFPIILETVRIEARSRDKLIVRQLDLNEPIQQPWWHRLEWLELPNEAPTTWAVSITWELQIRRKRHRVQNDNLPGLSHAPLRVAQSGDSWPRKDGWSFGDLHAHTAYTEDQVEFGAPLSAYPEMGIAQGLAFVFAADHSYDLDDVPGEFVRNDPQLQRFHERAAEISALNEKYQGKFALLPGLELSAANSRGKNVHLLLLGQVDFLPGSGDSAERWLSTKSELTVAQAIAQKGRATLPIAAHPLMTPPLLQRCLLGRGKWEKKDIETEGLWGLQIWNGETGEGFFRGVDLWVKGLLSGKRWKVIAGSDAHGNFNRNQQVGFPMLKLAESERHVFGKMRTGVYLEEGLGSAILLDGLCSNRSLISDGPFADLWANRIEAGSVMVTAEAQSSPEFGSLSEIRLYWGKPGKTCERVLLQQNSQTKYSWQVRLPVPEADGYLRAEVVTSRGHRCLTNPRFLSDPQL